MRIVNLELNKGLFIGLVANDCENSPIRKSLWEFLILGLKTGRRRNLIMVAVLEKLREIRDGAIEKMNKLITSIEAKDAETVEETTAGASKEAVKAEKKEALSEAPSAKSTVETNGEARSRKGWGGGLNKSELVRKYFEKHGLEVRNVDLIASIKKIHGVDVGAANVSIVRKQLGKAPKATKAKVVKAKAKTKVGKVTVKKATGLKGLPMPALCVEILKKAPSEGLKLGELAELVDSSGYEYTGDKGHSGMVQNVYQAVHNLSMSKTHPGYKGKVAVVIHDKTSKRYRMNPKAKKDVA